MGERAFQRKQREYQKADQARLDEGLRLLMSSPHGRAYLWNLLTISKAVGHTAMGQDAYETAFNCGMQNVGQRILAHITAVEPDGYVQMIQEQLNEQRSRTASLARSRADADPSDHFGSAAEG